ncbi:MAG: peptidylprolyl isomerase [Planctomycetota bacterium]|jgi:parvulin-like peptidyl-prolyl isomerase
MAITVDGERIEDAAVQREVERLRPHYERTFADKDPQERQAQLLEWSRENVVERVLLAQHARASGIQIPKTEVEAAVEQIKKQLADDQQLREEFGTADEKNITEQIESRMKVEQVLQELCNGLPDPSAEAVTKYYEQNKEKFQSPEQVRAAHLVKHISWQTDESAAQETMMKAAAELKEGTPFEVAVAKYSDCPDNAGDLGYITRGQMVEEFDDVVFNLGTDEPSEVFRTRFGFHIARIYDRRPAALLPLNQVEDQITSELKEQMCNKAVDEFIDQLKSKAQIREI